MPAFVIAAVEVTDTETYDVLRPPWGATLQPYRVPFLPAGVPPAPPHAGRGRSGTALPRTCRDPSGQPGRRSARECRTRRPCSR